MAFITLLENVDTVMKQSGPEVPRSDDFLGSRHTREVTPASVIVEIIQDSVGFVNGKTSPKNGVDPTSINNVPDKEVSGSLMANASVVISREVRPEILCEKVDDKVVVPGVIGGDEEEVFIREILIDGGSFRV
jgi:hypothetical protein